MLEAKEEAVGVKVGVKRSKKQSVSVTYISFYALSNCCDTMLLPNLIL